MQKQKWRCNWRGTFHPTLFVSQKRELKGTSRRLVGRLLLQWVCVLRCHDAVSIRRFENTDESDACVVDVAVKVVACGEN
jgi:hypothetical protein